MFVASYDLTGEYRWDYVGPDSGTQIPIGVDVDDVGNVTFVGHFSQEADFGGGTRVCANHQAAFVAQLDSEGDYRWDWANEDEGTSVGHAVAVDSNGGVYITGEFSGLIDFAGDRLGDSNSSLDSYVLAFGTDGRQRWGQSHGGTGAVRAFGIAAHGDIVYVTGYFGGEVSIADTTLVCSDGYDGFAFAVTTSGAHLWQRSFGGPGDEEARTIAVTDQLVYVGGRDPGHDTGPFVSMDVLVLALEQPANGSGN